MWTAVRGVSGPTRLLGIGSPQLLQDPVRSMSIVRREKAKLHDLAGFILVLSRIGGPSADCMECVCGCSCNRALWVCDMSYKMKIRRRDASN